MIDSSLLESIARLQSTDILSALHGALHQACSVLRPVERSKRNSASHKASNSTSPLGKKKLACTILALLEHASDLSARDESVNSDILSKISNAMKCNPWIWDLFVRKYFPEFMSNPAAASILAHALSEQSPEMQARGWASLTIQLRSAHSLPSSGMSTLQSLQQIAMLQVKSCFEFLTVHQMPLHGHGKSSLLKTENRFDSNSKPVAKMCILLRPQLPAALQLVLFCRPASNDGPFCSVPSHEKTIQQEGDMSVSDSANSIANDDIYEHGITYASILVDQMCNTKTLAEMLSLGSVAIAQDRSRKELFAHDRGNGTTQKLAKHESQDVKCKSDPNSDAADQDHRFSDQDLEVLQTAMIMVPVLVEALVSSPRLFDKISTDIGVAISTLLAIRWELSQLLAATGRCKLPSRLSPAPWSLMATVSVLRSTIGDMSFIGTDFNSDCNDKFGRKRTQETLIMPPAIVAHALEVASNAMASWKQLKMLEKYKPGNEKCDINLSKRAILDLVQVVIKIQKACFGGVFQPHLNIRSGAANEEAMRAANRIHAVLISQREEGKASDDYFSVERFGFVSKAPRETVKQRKKRNRDGRKCRAENAAEVFLSQLLVSVRKTHYQDELDNNGIEVLSDSRKTNQTNEHDGMKSHNKEIAEGQKKRRRITAERIDNIAKDSFLGTIPESSADTNSCNAKSRSSIAIFNDSESSGLDSQKFDGLIGKQPYAGPNVMVEDQENSDTPENENFLEGGRVIMKSTLLMDDEAREALWKAYIEDKERMVEMMGDSLYKEYYDENAHPTRIDHYPRSAGIDAAFDAVFGRAGDVIGDQTIMKGKRAAPTLPQTILETSLLYPWQAGLAASLHLLYRILEILELVDPKGLAPTVISILATTDERKQAAAAALRALEPNHSRNTWLALHRNAENSIAAGCTLHLISMLHTLLQRTSRRTAPKTLSGFLLLAKLLLPRAQTEESIMKTRNVSRSFRKLLQFVGPLVKGFSRFPPLLVTSLNKESASALPLLAAADRASLPDSIPYLSGLLWLCLALENSFSLRKPEWIRSQGAELLTHPLGAANSAYRYAAVDSLIPLLLEASVLLFVRDSNQSGFNQNSPSWIASFLKAENECCENESASIIASNSILPLVDSCAMMLYCISTNLDEHSQTSLHPSEKESKANKNDNREGNPNANLIPIQKTDNICHHFIDEISTWESIARFATVLCMIHSCSANALSRLLDDGVRESFQKSYLEEIFSRAEILAVGLDFVEIVQACLLPGGTFSARMQLPSTKCVVIHDLQNALDIAKMTQISCIEVLRSLPEDNEGCKAAVRALEIAAQLSVIPMTSTHVENPKDISDSLVGCELVLREKYDIEMEKLSGNRSDDENAISVKTANEVQDDVGEGRERPMRSAYERRRRLQDIQNPYLRAIVQESKRDAGDINDGDLSDLEDFIVANPERDYGDFIASHFPMAPESDDEVEDESDE